MTAIAVKIGKKKIEIAGDTQVSWGSNKLQMPVMTDKQVKANGKIFQVNGMTIGCAGDLSHIGLLQIYSKTHKPKEMDRESVLQFVLEFKEWGNKKAAIQFNDFSFHGIMINEGKAFSFYDFLDTNEVTKFDSVGSGMMLCLGAMEVGASAGDAVRVAIKYNLGCGGSVTILTINK